MKIKHLKWLSTSDLAENSDDLVMVKHYVKDALTQVNLKSDIFGVSSRQALRGNDEGINHRVIALTNL